MITYVITTNAAVISAAYAASLTNSPYAPPGDQANTKNSLKSTVRHRSHAIKCCAHSSFILETVHIEIPHISCASSVIRTLPLASSHSLHQPKKLLLTQCRFEPAGFVLVGVAILVLVIIVGDGSRQMRPNQAFVLHL